MISTFIRPLSIKKQEVPIQFLTASRHQVFIQACNISDGTFRYGLAER